MTLLSLLSNNLKKTNDLGLTTSGSTPILNKPFTQKLPPIGEWKVASKGYQMPVNKGEVIKSATPEQAKAVEAPITPQEQIDAYAQRTKDITPKILEERQKQKEIDNQNIPGVVKFLLDIPAEIAKGTVRLGMSANKLALDTADKIGGQDNPVSTFLKSSLDNATDNYVTYFGERPNTIQEAISKGYQSYGIVGAVGLGSLEVLGELPFLPGGRLSKLSNTLSKISDSRVIKAELASVYKGVDDKLLTGVAKDLESMTNPSEIKTYLKNFNSTIKNEINVSKAAQSATPELDEAYKIANGIKQKEPINIRNTIKNIGRSVDNSLISEYNPIKYLERDIYAASGIKGKPALNMARRFEQVNGAAGKARADILDFNDAVLKPLGNNAEHFNTYLFLKRTASRLLQDAEVKQVGNWTIEKVNSAMSALEKKIGGTLSKLDEVSKVYQDKMDKALKLQVESGRMSQAVYDTIKSENDFYAPFKVMKYIEESGTQQGGKPLQNLSDLTKAITGIKDSEFNLQNIILSSQEQIYKSRVLAEQNKTMSQLGELLDLDKTGLIKKVSSVTQKADNGFEIVRYFKNGVEQAIQVPKDVAVAIKGYNAAQASVAVKVMKAFAAPLRYGATSFNLGFSAVNFLSDQVRVMLGSKYGIDSVKDIVRYPMDLAQGLISAFRGNYGSGDALYRQFLSSGAANSTFQKIITPEVFVKTTTLDSLKKLPRVMFEKIAEFASSLEETTKLTAFKRGLRYEKIEKLSGDKLEKAMQELVYEVRNYGGSPDFARVGPLSRDLNTMFMFFNARLQGTLTDLSRISGIEGKGITPKVWARLGIASVPLVYVAILNNSDEIKKDYNQRTSSERGNYIMIPTSKFYKDSDGVVRREYYKIHKRGMLSWVDTTINQTVEFLKNHDPKAFSEWAGQILGDISPLNFTGDNTSERLESIAAGINPFFKVPLEYSTNRNFYFHNDTVSKSKQDLSPQYQSRANTSKFFIWAGEKLGESPAKLEQAVTSLTGGFSNQFLIGETVQGRSKLSELPVFKRFFGSTYFQDEMLEAASKYLTKGKDRSYLLKQKAEAKVKELDEIKSSSPEEANRMFNEIKRTEPLLAEKIKDVKKEMKLNYTYTERLISNMPVANGTRAEFIYEQLMKLENPEDRDALYKTWREKKLITDEVKAQISKLKNKK